MRLTERGKTALLYVYFAVFCAAFVTVGVLA